MPVTAREVFKVKLLRLICLTLALLPAFPPVLMAEEEPPPPPQLLYYQLKPSLVANLAAGGRYVRCDIQLMTHEETFLETLALHDAAIRHTLLLLLADQDGAKIKTPSGKEALRRQALSQLNQLLKELSGQGEVDSLFFTTFYVQ